MTVKAKDLHMGHTIRVDSGKGPTNRIIDDVRERPDGSIDVTLYTPFGRRPVINLSPDYPVEVTS